MATKSSPTVALYKDELYFFHSQGKAAEWIGNSRLQGHLSSKVAGKTKAEREYKGILWYNLEDAPIGRYPLHRPNEGELAPGFTRNETDPKRAKALEKYDRQSEAVRSRENYIKESVQALVKAIKRSKVSTLVVNRAKQFNETDLLRGLVIVYAEAHGIRCFLDGLKTTDVVEKTVSTLLE